MHKDVLLHQTKSTIQTNQKPFLGYWYWRTASSYQLTVFSLFPTSVLLCLMLAPVSCHHTIEGTLIINLLSPVVFLSLQSFSDSFQINTLITVLWKFFSFSSSMLLFAFRLEPWPSSWFSDYIPSLLGISPESFPASRQPPVLASLGLSDCSHFTIPLLPVVFMLCPNPEILFLPFA